MDAIEPQRPRGPRLYHKKSRTGCIRCKQRRVKCDEHHPKCGGCARHNVDCLYPYQIASPTSSKPHSSPAPPRSRARAAAAAAAAQATGRTTRPSSSSPKLLEPNALTSPSDGLLTASKSPSVAESPQSQGSHPSPGSDDGEPGTDTEIPESRDRRLWEMRLLHNHLTMCHPFHVTPTYKLQQLWEIDVPNMALRDGWDVILYGILAHSALNMWSRAETPKERDHLIILQQTYKSMLLREQARQVVNMTSRNADVLCFSSLKILTHALALVQTLPMDPWQPPLEWLRMGKGAGAVFRAALGLVDRDDADSKIMMFLEHPPIMTDPGEHVASDHGALAWLLAHPEPGTAAARTDDAELADPAARAAYEAALGYTCSVARAIARGEPEAAVGRRLGGFAVWMSNDFTEFLIERRPRAMVILAHFMALWLDYDHIWIIGKAGERQIRGIHKSLPLAWSSKLDGLFAKLGKRSASQASVPAAAGPAV